MALRSRLKASSMASRNGSQKLVDGASLGLFCPESLNSTPNPVVTSSALAGFAFALSLLGRYSVLVLVLGLTALAGFAASDPVVTSLAGFAGARRPHAPVAAPRSRPLSGRRRRSPDAPRSLARCAARAIRVVPGLSLVVFSLRSRRCSYRRRLLPYAGLNVPEPSFPLAGFEVTLIGRFWVTPEGLFALCCSCTR